MCLNRTCMWTKWITNFFPLFLCHPPRGRFFPWYLNAPPVVSSSKKKYVPPPVLPSISPEARTRFKKRNTGNDADDYGSQSPRLHLCAPLSFARLLGVSCANGNGENPLPLESGRQIVVPLKPTRGHSSNLLRCPSPCSNFSTRSPF